MGKRQHLLEGPDEITITGTSQTLEELGVTLNSAMVVLTLISGNMYLVSWAKGETAVDGTNPMPSFESLELKIYPDEAALLEFVTDGTEVKMSIMQEG